MDDFKDNWGRSENISDNNLTEEFNENPKNYLNEESNEESNEDLNDIDKYFENSDYSENNTIPKTSDRNENFENSEICLKCKGTGIVKEKDGSVHVCWDCLQNGKLDVHSKNVKDSGLRI